MKPGDKIRFEKVSVAEAHRILKEKERTIQAWKEKSNLLR
jgi:allophanate hydrolase subunit 2